MPILNFNSLFSASTISSVETSRCARLSLLRACMSLCCTEGLLASDERMTRPCWPRGHRCCAGGLNSEPLSTACIMQEHWVHGQLTVKQPASSSIMRDGKGHMGGTCGTCRPHACQCCAGELNSKPLSTAWMQEPWVHGQLAAKRTACSSVMLSACWAHAGTCGHMLATC